MPEAHNQRLLFVDVARSYAVFLALLSHAFIIFGVYGMMGDASIYLRQFTRTATPMFVLMFGFMVEYVYVKRAKRDGIHSINERLVERSVQCYLAYVVTVFAAYLGGYKSLQGCVASLLFLSDSMFGNILRAYCIMLLVMPWIIRLRLRYGIKIIYGFLCGLFMLYVPIATYGSALSLSLLDKPLNIFFGVGPIRAGPSILGAFSFFATGMILASCFSTNVMTGIAKKVFLSALSLFTLFILSWNLLIPKDIADAWLKYLTGHYRRGNHVGYFVIGNICAVSTFLMIYFVVRGRWWMRLCRLFVILGTSSLIAYTAGNVLLNLFGKNMQTMNPGLCIPVFFLTVILITKYLSFFPFYDYFHELNQKLNSLVVRGVQKLNLMHVD